VTQPTAAMREAMARAEVGDDVYGEDPSIIALEAKVAAMMGKEAALYVSSGTQSNLLGVLSHCQRGEEYLIGDVYHVYKSEALGTSVLGGVASYPLKTDATGGLDPAQVHAGVKPDDPHSPITRLLCLENTVSGRVQAPERAHMAERGIVLSGQKPKIRVVTHLDVTAEDVDRVLEAVAEFYKGR
jgi:threonine aldolase